MHRLFFEHLKHKVGFLLIKVCTHSQKRCTGSQSICQKSRYSKKAESLGWMTAI